VRADSAVNGTAVAAVLIDQSRSFQPTAYGSRDRRTASEAEKLFRLPLRWVANGRVFQSRLDQV